MIYNTDRRPARALICTEGEAKEDVPRLSCEMSHRLEVIVIVQIGSLMSPAEDIFQAEGRKLNNA